MKKKIASLALSVTLVCITILGLQNSKVVEAADNLILLEKRHPGYWEYLREKVPMDVDGDGTFDVSVFSLSKMNLSKITSSDYQIFLRDGTRDSRSRVIYFYDGTGIDVRIAEYGDVDIGSWTIQNGTQIADIKDVQYKEKPIYEITDLYEYLASLKNYSFIISVKDDASNGWGDSLNPYMRDLGLTGSFKYRESYIAVVDRGKVLFEETDHSQIEWSGNFEDVDIQVLSSGFDSSASSSIVINDVEYSKQRRGLNIVVIDNNEVIDSVNFDTWNRLLLCNR